MEAWRKIWRDGFAPLITDKGLLALKEALESPSRLSQLGQGSTTWPIAMIGSGLEKPQGACLIGYCAWKGSDLATVGEIDSEFARLCFEADQRVKEPAGCRFLLNWWDERPYEEVVACMLPEVDREIARRQNG